MIPIRWSVSLLKATTIVAALLFLQVLATSSVWSQTPRTYRDPIPRGGSMLSKLEILAAFEALAYGSEAEEDSSTRIERWNQTVVGINLSGTFTVNETYPDRPWFLEAHAVLDLLDDIPSVPELRVVRVNEQPNIVLLFYLESESDILQRRLSDAYASIAESNCTIVGRDADGVHGRLRIFIKYDRSIEAIRSCLVSMLSRALGFRAHASGHESGVSNLIGDPAAPYLTNLDYYLISILYDRRFDPALSRSAGMARAREIVDDLFEQK